MLKAKVIVTMLSVITMVIAPVYGISTNAQDTNSVYVAKTIQVNTSGIAVAAAQTSKYNTLNMYYNGVNVGYLTHNTVWETWKYPKSQTLTPTMNSGYSASSITYRYENYDEYTAAWATADIYKGTTYIGKATMAFFCDKSMTFATDKVFEPY